MNVSYASIEGLDETPAHYKKQTKIHNYEPKKVIANILQSNKWCHIKSSLQNLAKNKLPIPKKKKNKLAVKTQAKFTIYGLTNTDS